ncbi:MAG: hypothetical protein DWQ05_11060 [Calditrichaeota bacterium]|nr:MAG: hypothetical protein DWQ05_11060 [Calditrichota bacterium]
MTELQSNIENIEDFLLQQKDLWGESILMLGIEQPKVEFESPVDNVQKIPIIESSDKKGGPRLKIPAIPDKQSQMKDFAGRLKNYEEASLLGQGNLNAKVVFLAGSIEQENIAKNKIFLGENELIFSRMLTKLGFTLEEIYLTPAYKFPGNSQRDTAVSLAQNILIEQLKIIQPRYIFCLGNEAAQTLFANQQKLEEMRGRPHSFHGIKTIVSFSPAQLVEDKQLFWQAFEDMKLFRNIFDREIGGKPAME